MPDKPQFEFRLNAKRLRNVPGGSPGYWYHGDGARPDDKTLRSIVDLANESLKTCAHCPGAPCQTWALANATIEQVRELVFGHTAPLPTPDTN